MTTKTKAYLGYAVGFTVALASTLYIGHTNSKTRLMMKPKNAAEFAQTSVMVVMNNEASGGSGVILQSKENESVILTNKHVCEVIQGGGLVKTQTKKYRVYKYKLYGKHDLCMIKVKANLGVETIIATQKPVLYSHVWVSGHPNLLPHVLTEGYFSDYKTIDVMVGMKACDGKETSEEEVMSCLFYGAKPIVKRFKSQLVTATIMPGSSGSGVFDENGEIAGLVFAGSSQGLSYGFIVPLAYVRDFVLNESRYRWRTPFSGSKGQFFNKTMKTKIQMICHSYKSFFSDECREANEF